MKMLLLLRPFSGLYWGHRLPVSSLGAAAEGARGRQVPSSVAQAGGGGLWDLAGYDALARFGGRTERNSLLEQREEASKRQERRKHGGNPTVAWCDAFL